MRKGQMQDQEVPACKRKRGRPCKATLLKAKLHGYGYAYRYRKDTDTRIRRFPKKPDMRIRLILKIK